MATWLSNSDYLHERIASRTSRELPEAAETDFCAWREVLNVSGPQIFHRRLQSLGLDENRARELTQRVEDSDKRLDRDESEMLREALVSSKPDPLFWDSAQPFAEIWAPFSRYGVSQLTSCNPDLISDSAVAQTVRFLHVEIARLAAEATYLVFDKYRGQGKSFEEFVHRQQENQCQDIFASYPALARCIHLFLRDWIKTTNLFFSRLEADAALLSARFGIGEVPLTSVTMGLSDRHAGGFQVIRADFGDRKILYKPKDMSLETLLPKINEWLSAGKYWTLFRFPNSLDCDGYGWSEWIEQQPCLSKEEVRRYYRQSGALLCLAHLLNAKDLLFENIVAYGADPVPIDLETFLQPEARTFDLIGKPFDGSHPAYRWKGSVIDTALLPFWQFSSSHPMCDLSGLGCKNKDLPPAAFTEWRSINTTEMRPAAGSGRPYRTKNEVLYLGKVQEAADFIDEIEAGFADLHGFVANRKDSLLEFLSSWAGAKSRLIFRPTQLYTLLMQKSLEAKNLESGIRRSIVLEQLYRPVLRNGLLTPELQSLFDFERDALLRLDVPRFYLSVGSADLDLGQQESIAAFLWAPPLETVKRRIQHASESSLKNHLEVIRSSLIRRPKVVSLPLDGNEQLKLVRDYADLIAGKADPGKSSFLWDLPSFVEAEVTEIERLALYSGEIGILIFLAAADRVLGRRIPKLLLESCYHKLENFSEDSAPLGIGNGIGGLIYGSLVLGDILEDQSWKRLAAALAERLPDARVQTEQEPDLLYGVAGFLLALKKLHQSQTSERTRDLAHLCLESLATGFRTDTGWMRPNGDCSLGFAHGTAGIAYALASAGTMVNEGLALDLAKKSIEFDRPYFDKESHNWPATTRHNDLRMRAWCSGLTGMLLSRAGVWDRSHDPQLQQEIEEGLMHIPDLLGLDHWCCGSAGMAEVLIYLSRILDREDLLTKARGILDGTVRRSLKSVYYRFSPEIGDNYCFQPSLFRGLAGIGYTLLRAMNPADLPCIVAFE